MSPVPISDVGGTLALDEIREYAAETLEKRLRDPIYASHTTICRAVA